jgi:hypothetical protein
MKVQDLMTGSVKSSRRHQPGSCGRANVGTIAAYSRDAAKAKWLA